MFATTALLCGDIGGEIATDCAHRSLQATIPCCRSQLSRAKRSKYDAISEILFLKSIDRERRLRFLSGCRYLI
jgi:hypothetical protein